MVNWVDLLAPLSGQVELEYISIGNPWWKNKFYLLIVPSLLFLLPALEKKAKYNSCIHNEKMSDKRAKQ